ncbi:MAG TPA: cytochrome c peroxidase [Candidatus Xenobia bacterium]|nr:cytochrome c peroxidase [Candidatus Xenobia bacterium]
MRGRTFIVLVLLLVLIGVGYWFASQRGPAPPPSTTPIGAPLTLTAPLGLPPVPVPPDNPPTVETIALGRRLYYDPILSVDNTVSCATCHHPDFGFSDGKPVSEGVHGKKGNRNAPTVINAAYNAVQFWDGRAPSLEEQAGGPMQNPVEMAHTMEGVEEKLNADPSYREEFKKAFGADRITFGMVTKAIASFERTVIAGNSPFDRWYYGKDEKAVSDAVKRGFEVFRDPKKGNCAACHSVGEQNALFTDNKFHNIGVGVKLDKYGNPEFTDQGRFEVTKNEADRGAFKTPGLRNIAQTAPYMHDGSLKTLKDVIDFYVGGGNSNPNLDKEIHTLVHLSGKEREDLLAFLESLTGKFPYEVGPPTTTSAQPARLEQARRGQ